LLLGKSKDLFNTEHQINSQKPLTAVRSGGGLSSADILQIIVRQIGFFRSGRPNLFLQKLQIFENYSISARKRGRGWGL